VNRLKDSGSLYLRQHAQNPVDWHPWDETALKLARESGKPILLSIGYSACHWCHVMAHESFEDPETAALMNELFVNIKLDREERPDLDKLYQLSHQLLTQRGGGWPLTVFLDPDELVPFFAGTYFPPAPRHGMPAFSEILQKIREWFDGNRDAVREQNERLTGAINSLQKSVMHEDQLDMQVYSTAWEQISRSYDSQHGGFGGAPKFPQAPLLALLQAMSQMNMSQKKGSFASDCRQMLHETLRKMALSGLRDHLDGGFFRYTVDGSWTIPHFEKMLYDNAMLLPIYAESAASTGDPLLREAAEGIGDWLLTEMCEANGGFFASMDADADGKEGDFHVWQRQALIDLLSEDEYAAVAPHFGIDGPANFEGHYWHLVRTGSSGQHTDKDVLERAKEKMRDARRLRIPPATDTKQLTSWNALCIEGFSRAGLALQRKDWIEAAGQTLSFIRNSLWRDETLYSVYAQGRACFPGYLDDHAFLLKAILAHLRVSWNSEHLSFARQLAGTMMAKFSDPECGGFFFSVQDQEMPIARLRTLQDDATPAGNGIAAIALESLGHLCADQAYLDAAGRTLQGSYQEQGQQPLGHATLLVALYDHLHPPVQIIISGTDEEEKQAWKAAISGHDRVNCYVLGPESGDLADELPLEQPRDRTVVSGLYHSSERTTAYVCEGLRCLQPAESLDTLHEQLKSLPSVNRP